MSIQAGQSTNEHVTARCRLVFTFIAILAYCEFSNLQLHAQVASPDGMFRAAIQSTGQRTAKIFGASVGSVDGYGTGLIVADDGRIIASDGVYLKGSSVRVVLNDGSTHEASVLKRDQKLKLALLKIEASTPDFFSLSEQPVGAKGDWILAISNAFKVAERTEPLSVNMGLITLRTSIKARIARRETIYDGPIILIDAITSNPGASGGAIVTADGRLVGMIGRIIESNETNTRLNYAVPQEELHAFLTGKRKVEPQTVPANNAKPGDLGIRLFRLDGDKSPAYVDRVNRGSAARTAGVRTDDLIISIGGKSIANITQYNEMAKTLIPGETTVIVVKRRKELLRIELVVPAEKE